MTSQLNLNLCKWSSGIIGKAKEFNGARLSVAVVFALFIVTGVCQQWPLRMPGYSEGWRLALNLPQFLPYRQNTVSKMRVKLSLCCKDVCAHPSLLQRCR